MKKTVILLLFLFSVMQFQAQTAKEVDSIVRLYPKNFSSTEQLAQKIKSDFRTEFGKARAIFSWLAYNLKYDVKAFLHPKPLKVITYKTEEERQRKQRIVIDKRIDEAFRKRKGVCQHYSELFDRIASQAGLETQVNIGDAKTRNYDIGRKRARVNHAWNSVKIDGVWRLIDVTWGAGYVDFEEEKFYFSFNPVYFDVAPKIFFTEHYPEKGIWFDTVVDKEEFLKAPLINTNIINGKYEILEPKTGVIETCLNEKVAFKIVNVSPDSRISYSLKKENETAQVITKIQKENVVEFEILIDRKIPRYLTLFVNGKSIATFKISLYRF